MMNYRKDFLVATETAYEVVGIRRSGSEKAQDYPNDARGLKEAARDFAEAVKERGSLAGTLHFSVKKEGDRTLRLVDISVTDGVLFITVPG